MPRALPDRGARSPPGRGRGPRTCGGGTAAGRARRVHWQVVVGEVACLVRVERGDRHPRRPLRLTPPLGRPTLRAMRKIRGVDLAVTDLGTGPAFFWGHGFASCTANEADMMLGWDRLAAHHRVIRWDARGHGQSSGTNDPADYEWENLGRDVIALADALGIESFAIGGASMGAATVLHRGPRARTCDGPRARTPTDRVGDPCCAGRRVRERRGSRGAARAGGVHRAAQVATRAADPGADRRGVPRLHARDPRRAARRPRCAAQGRATCRHRTRSVRSQRRRSCSPGPATPVIPWPPPSSWPSSCPTPS